MSKAVTREIRSDRDRLAAATERPERGDTKAPGLPDAWITWSGPARRDSRPVRSRGWLLRRLLVLADLVGLLAAFLVAREVFAPPAPDKYGFLVEVGLFLIALPVWVVTAHLVGLYDRDGERTDHSTADDLVGVFAVVTIGAWLVWAGAWLSNTVSPDQRRIVMFWALAVALVVTGRIVVRTVARRTLTYLQNTIIVGAGDVGQLVARKILQHPEYGINLVGFVDSQPRERRADLRGLTLLGSPNELRELIEVLDIERVVIAFSNEGHNEMLALLRGIRELGVQVDIVPRLFEMIGPKVNVHTLEGVPMLGLPPARLSRSSRILKRTIDVIGASLCLLATAPLFAFIAWRIRRDSRGPIFFRQTRLGLNVQEFEALKFRTMFVETDNSAHRSYIRDTMSAQATVGENGLYKLERKADITPFGRWLRRTSLDELPQLINVLRGDMSLVGPRPCIRYETEHFAPHHFERFLVLPGLTGLWQVTARARSTFGEALDMDVAYARGWSLGLDLRLLCKTPLAVLRQGKTTA